jgi:hypothetical protein
VNNAKTLEALILADIAVSVLSAVSDAVFGQPAPAGPRGAGGWAPPGDLSFALWIAVCAGTVLAWIGLLNLLRAARTLYAASWIGYLALAVFRAPAPGSAIGSTLDLLAGLVGGMILAVVYFSKLGARFRPIGPASSEALPAG